MVSHGGNATGAAMAGAIPGFAAGGTETDAGLNAREMLASPTKAYLLWDVEPEFDLANPELVKQALESAESVVAVSSFAGDSLKATADVILPLAPLAESEGLFYTFDGQSFAAEPAVKIAGHAKPGWKILRRLGTELELDGFSQVDITSLREEMLAEIGDVSFATAEVELAAPQKGGDLYRVGEVAMYGLDALCRRSEYLQQTVHAENDFVGLSPDDAGSKGLVEGHKVKVSQGSSFTTLPVRICNELPTGAVWVKSATEPGKALGDSFGPIRVEAA
jgi:NADH-quinone oxidoreductase subunit G